MAAIVAYELLLEWFKEDRQHQDIHQFLADHRGKEPYASLTQPDMDAFVESHNPISTSALNVLLLHLMTESDPESPPLGLPLQKILSNALDEERDADSMGESTGEKIRQKSEMAKTLQQLLADVLYGKSLKEVMRDLTDLKSTLQEKVGEFKERWMKKEFLPSSQRFKPMRDGFAQLQLEKQAWFIESFASAFALLKKHLPTEGRDINAQYVDKWQIMKDAWLLIKSTQSMAISITYDKKGEEIQSEAETDLKDMFEQVTAGATGVVADMTSMTDEEKLWGNVWLQTQARTTPSTFWDIMLGTAKAVTYMSGLRKFLTSTGKKQIKPTTTKLTATKQIKPKTTTTTTTATTPADLGRKLNDIVKNTNVKFSMKAAAPKQTLEQKIEQSEKQQKAREARQEAKDRDFVPPEEPFNAETETDVARFNEEMLRQQKRQDRRRERESHPRSFLLTEASTARKGHEEEDEEEEEEEKEEEKERPRPRMTIMPGKAKTGIKSAPIRLSKNRIVPPSPDVTPIATIDLSQPAAPIATGPPVSPPVSPFSPGSPFTPPGSPTPSTTPPGSPPLSPLSRREGPRRRGHEMVRGEEHPSVAQLVPRINDNPETRAADLGPRPRWLDDVVSMKTRNAQQVLEGVQESRRSRRLGDRGVKYGRLPHEMKAATAHSDVRWFNNRQSRMQWMEESGRTQLEPQKLMKMYELVRNLVDFTHDSRTSIRSFCEHPSLSFEEGGRRYKISRTQKQLDVIWQEVKNLMKAMTEESRDAPAMRYSALTKYDFCDMVYTLV